MMKKFIAFIFAALFAVGAWAHEYEATVNGVKWYYNLISDGNGGYNAEITYRGFYSSEYANEYSGSLTIPSRLGGYKVTSIGEDAFYGRRSLKSVTIPNSVTTIGKYAFDGCSSLTSVSIPNSVTSIGEWAFCGCSSLTSVTIPNSVTKIGSYAFSGTPFYNNKPGGLIILGKGCLYKYKGTCPSSVTIPDGVTTIGSWAFEDCSSLTSVTIPNSVTTIGDAAFYNCSSLTSVTIPNSVKWIGESAFYNCSSLKEVHIKDLAKWCAISFGSSYANPCYYAKHLYLNGEEIKDLVVPDSVTTIGSSAFSGCSSLKSVTIPNSVTTIGDEAFCGCSSLKSVTIPNSVTSIEYAAFSHCDSLTSVTIPDSVTTIRANSFSTCSSLKEIIGWRPGCPKNVERIVISNSVTAIGNTAFYNCSSLTSVTIPDSVTAIGNKAFENCSSLTSFKVGEYNPNYKSINGLLCSKDGKTIVFGVNGDVTIPDGVTTIGSSAFYSCSSLTSVTIPDSVTTIERYAFYGCSSLTSVTIPNSVTTIGAYAFPGCSSLMEINVANDNSSYCSKDGILYSKNMAKLVACPGAKTSVMIPDSVTTIGSSAFYSCSSLTSVTIPDSVTTIGDAAFYNCSSLTSVTIPNSVTTIGAYAFSGCSSLQKVILEPGSKISPSANWGISTDKIVQQEDVKVRIKNKNDSVIYDGKSHTAQYEVVSDVDGFSAELIGYEGRALPTKINVGLYAVPISASDFKYIGGDIRFRNVDIGCEDSIVSLEILPRKVVIKSSDAKRIYDGVPLTNSDFKVSGNGFVDGECVVSAVGSQTNVGSSPNSISVVWRNNGKASNYEITKNEGVLTITGWPKVVDGALANSFTSESISVKEISVPDGVETVSNDIFAKMTSLRKAKFPDTLYSIDSHAFDPCPNLEWEMRGGYKFMDGWLFGYTEEAEEEIPDVDSIRGIADGALDGCMAIKRFECSNKAILKRIPPKAFADCGKLKSVILPEVLEEIGDEAFVGCSEVLNFIIPGSVKTIGNRAFAYCSKLTNAQVSSGVERIGDEAFLCCWQISDVDIPSTVTWVGTNAFGGDSSIIRAGMRGDIRKISEVFSNYRHIREFIIKPGTGALKNRLFSGCEELKDVRILGDCPSMEYDGAYLYENAGTYRHPITNEKIEITTYVTEGSLGWNGRANSTALPQAWPLTGSYRHSIAYWDVPTYLCVFHSNGGSLGNQKTYQKSEQPFELPATPTQSGYAFLGWYTSPIGGIRITEKNIFIEGVYQDLYAHWGKARKIVLDANGGAIELGSVVLVEQTTYGVLPAPVRTGYAFGGWTYNGQIVVPNMSILTDTDHKLVAQWEALKYKVVFNANYGVGEADDMICEYNKDYVAPKSGFVMSGKKLVGWALEPRGSVAIKTGAKFRNLAAEEGRIVTLYAVYEYDSNYVEKAPLILKLKSEFGTGTLTGAGDYQSGKKITLKATPAKGYVFSGWYKDGELVSKAAGFTLVTDGTYSIYFGEFITAAEDRGSIAIAVNGMEPEEIVDSFEPLELPVGVLVNWPIEATALSATTVKVAGLPAGLKLVQDKITKEYSIQGTPTAASKVDKKTGAVVPSLAKFTVTTAGKNSRVFTMPITTTAMEPWVVGTFNGGLVDSEGEEFGLVTLTTTAAGKISGKILKNGQTWTVSAVSFDSYDEEGYHATLTAKSGKLDPETYEIVISEEGAVGSNEYGEKIEAYWNFWKTPEGKLLGKELAANPEIKKNGLPLPEGFDLESYGLASLTLKFAASGAVTATGMFEAGAFDKKGNPVYYKATCSTVLIPTESGYRVYLYFAPNVKKNFDGNAFVLEL